MKRPLSGKFIVRVSSELHQRLKEQSEKQNLSLNKFCQMQLSRSVDLPNTEATQTLAIGGLPFPDLQNALLSMEASVCAIVLFGSLARGEGKGHSDLDLLVVVPPGFPVSRELYALWDKNIQPLLSTASREVSPQFVSLPKSVDDAGGIWFEVALEGIVLWGKDFCVSRFLATVRKAIVGREITRKSSHGHPYWVRRNHAK